MLEKLTQPRRPRAVLPLHALLALLLLGWCPMQDGEPPTRVPRRGFGERGGLPAATAAVPLPPLACRLPSPAPAPPWPPRARTASVSSPPGAMWPLPDSLVVNGSTCGWVLQSSMRHRCCTLPPLSPPLTYNTAD